MRPGIIGALFAFIVNSYGGALQNLGFDEANTNAVRFSGPFSFGVGPTTELLPGWELTQGGSSVTNIGFNLVVVDIGSTASIFDNDPGSGYPASTFPVEGRYALSLSEVAGAEPFVLSQVGTIPSGAVFISYRYRDNPVALNINAERLLPLGGYHFASDPEYNVFNISGFAGRQVQLELSTLELLPLAPQQVQFIDSITFAVPEPSPMGLLVLSYGFTGVIYFTRRMKVHRKRI